MLHSASKPMPVALSLSQAVKIAIKDNVDIQVERENIRLSESAFFLESARFDPTISFDLNADRTVRSSSSLIETGPSGTNRITTENQRLGSSIKQRFRSGGDLDLTFRQNRGTASFQDLNPTLRADLILSFSQPLLQGFGRVFSEAPLRIANTNIKISQEVFEAHVSALILDVSKAYWDLVFHLKNLEVQQQTLKSAKQLLKSTEAKVSLGLLAPIEILVSESGVATRDEAVFIAEKRVFDTEDKLRVLLNLPGESIINPLRIVPSDQPTEKKEHIDALAVLQVALLKRPEVAQSNLLLKNQVLASKIAKNKLSPSLDLLGNIGLNGLGQDFSDEIDQIGSGSFNQWETGLVLSFPLGNRAARADLQKEKAKLKQAMLGQRKIIQRITLETKEGLRGVHTDYQRIIATQRARHLAKEKLSAGNERFHLGLISSQDLLEFQDDLAEARANALKAVTDYNKSLVNLEHVSGTLLNRYHLEAVSRKTGR